MVYISVFRCNHSEKFSLVPKDQQNYKYKKFLIVLLGLLKFGPHAIGRADKLHFFVVGVVATATEQFCGNGSLKVIVFAPSVWSSSFYFVHVHARVPARHPYNIFKSGGSAQLVESKNSPID